MKYSKNSSLINQINSSSLWFHYKKAKPVWAKKLSENIEVETLEGKIQYKKGDILCKGPAGDIWGQKKESFKKKYDPKHDLEPDKDGWQEFLPKPDAEGVMAVQVDHDFTVEHPQWGTFQGKAGDYLVKNYKDKDIKYPEDIWIVNERIFESTYEKFKLADRNLEKRD